MTNILMGIEELMLGPREQMYSDAVPVHLRDGLRRYVEHGILPGSFLRALICNDLWDTLCRADDSMDRELITATFRWLYECAPAECFGSAHKMAAWNSKGGLKGRDAA